MDFVCGVLNPEQCRVALVFETLEIERYVRDTGLSGGRPFYSLKPTARAFVVKSVLNIATTLDLISRLRVDHGLRTLCGFGWRIPSESTFSRHFKVLSEKTVLDIAHESLVREHVGSETVHHVCRDSSQIDGREKPKVRVKFQRIAKRKRGRPAKGSEPVAEEPSRIERQLEQDFETSFKELPRTCDVGGKTNSKGHPSYWVGFKLHLDVSDGGLPLSAFTSSASLHDSQVAIPLSLKTADRVGGVFYELMDKGYDAEGIKQAVRRQDHVPIIQPKDRRDHKAVPLDAAQAQRFKIRTTIERSFSDIKDNLGGRFVRVRAPDKVHAHLMFGVLTLFALVLLRSV